MTPLKGFLWLFFINISCVFISGQIIETDPCMRKPCLPDEICVKQTRSQFLCLKQNQAVNNQNTLLLGQPVANIDEDSQILNNLVNFDSNNLPKNQKPIVAQKPVGSISRPNEDLDILNGLFQNPSSVPSSVKTPLLPRVPVDIQKPVLTNNIVNQAKTEDAQILETILGDSKSNVLRPLFRNVDESNVQVIDNPPQTIPTDSTLLSSGSNVQRVIPNQLIDVLPENRQSNNLDSASDDSDSQILKVLLNPHSPEGTITTITTTTMPKINGRKQSIQSVQSVQSVSSQGTQTNSNLDSTDAQIIQNILNNQIPFAPKTPTIVPETPNLGTKAEVKPQNKDIKESDLDIIKTLLNNNPVTTTTRLPPWKVGVKQSKAGNVKTDMDFILALRNKYRKTPVNVTQVPTVAPTRGVEVPLVRPIENPTLGGQISNPDSLNGNTLPLTQPKQQSISNQISAINQQVIVETQKPLGGDQTSASKLREQLRSQSGIPVDQTKNLIPINNIGIDNIIQKLVEDADTTTTTTTTTPKPIKKEPYCMGYRNGDQIPHPTDSKKFIVCQFNDYVIMACPATLVYNRYLNRCDRNDNQPPKACLSSPCRNGGKCNDTENYGFICECASGFSGSMCEKGIDPCFSNPCSPNGACNSLESFKMKTIGYYCLCFGGKSYGLNCDHKTFLNPCVRYHSESYYPSELSPSLFIHCESDIMNLKSCHEPLVWSQKVLTCVTEEELDATEDTFEFVDDNHS